MTDCLLVLDQKIPYRLIKVAFPGKVGITVRLGSKSRLVIMGFSTNDAVTRLKGSVCLCISKPNKAQIGVCSQKKRKKEGFIFKK